MEANPPQLCKLRPEITQLDFADQLALILACKERDSEAYRKLEIKHAALRDWIEHK